MVLHWDTWPLACILVTVIPTVHKIQRSRSNGKRKKQQIFYFLSRFEMQLQSNRVTEKDTEGTIDSVCVNGVMYVN